MMRSVKLFVYPSVCNATNMLTHLSLLGSSKIIVIASEGSLHHPFAILML